MHYFLLALSNRENLELCRRHALAGFTSSTNGVWAFVEISKGDYVSFLYGAKAYDLYIVERKVAYRDAEQLPPWKPITYRSGHTYSFPFRLHLKPIRTFEESLVRPEFAYVAENLLLRGGYRKTHFQADQTTLHHVSQLGQLTTRKPKSLDLSAETFIPKFTLNRKLKDPPYVFLIEEVIIQSLVRHYLERNLPSFIDLLSLEGLGDLEVLSEKALAEGHVDILIKEAEPKGYSRSIVVEVKRGTARKADFEQVARYRAELGPECLAAVLIAKEFPRRTDKAVSLKYILEIDPDGLYTFEELLNLIRLEPV